MDKAWRYLVQFADGSRHLSRDVRIFDPGWNGQAFQRPVESLQFFLPGGHSILLSGMSEYNLFVEASQNLRGGQSRLEAIWLCGRVPGSDAVEMWCIGQGKIVRQSARYGQEWGGGPTRGWKAGVPGNSVRSEIVKLK